MGPCWLFLACGSSTVYSLDRLLRLTVGGCACQTKDLGQEPPYSALGLPLLFARSHFSTRVDASGIPMEGGLQAQDRI